MEGQQFPESMEVTALSLFQLFFDDKVVERIHVITHTSAYAESATKAQVLVCQSELMICQRYELLGYFVHVEKKMP